MQLHSLQTLDVPLLCRRYMTKDRESSHHPEHHLWLCCLYYSQLPHLLQFLQSHFFSNRNRLHCEAHVRGVNTSIYILPTIGFDTLEEFQL